ncbi:MAG: hypothetical protein IPN29_02060 [Saprospiraceae bacterium]|nr:hypothetical protein [Saprospiraceae bacterium]
MRNNIFEAKAFGFDIKWPQGHPFEQALEKVQRINKQLLRRNALKKKLTSPLKILNVEMHYNNAEYFIHTNASGDFMLMHSSQWYKLRGYCETFYMTTHNDSELVINAYASGLKMHFLQYPIYHQDHDRRYSAANPDIQRDARIQYKKLQQQAKRVLFDMRPEVVNTFDWGLAGTELQTLLLKHK